MDKDQLDGLLALKMVVEKQNFANAARELGVSSSAVSQLIKKLEGRLGIAMLTRTTRATHLTESGEKFLNQAGPALDQILAALEEVGAESKKPSGLLRLNMPRVIYSTYLAPIIKSFTEKFPDVTVELFFEDQQTDIFRNGFDAGIRLSDILAKDVVALKLFGPIRFVTAGAPKYFARVGRPKHPKDLLSYNCIVIRLGAGLYDRWEFENRGKDFQVHVKGNLIFNDSTLMREAAIDGAGLIYTVEDSITEQVKSGKLEIVLPQYVATSEGFYLYFPHRAQVQPKLRAFVDHVKNEIRPRIR